MKFQIRDGFVVHLITDIDLGDGKTQRQENTFYGGQQVDLTDAQADEHCHKLAPVDAKAKAYLDGKVAPITATASLGLTAENLALVQAMAAEMAKQIVAAMKPAAPAA